MLNQWGAAPAENAETMVSTLSALGSGSTLGQAVGAKRAPLVTRGAGSRLGSASGSRRASSPKSGGRSTSPTSGRKSPTGRPGSPQRGRSFKGDAKSAAIVPEPAWGQLANAILVGLPNFSLCK